MADAPKRTKKKMTRAKPKTKKSVAKIRADVADQVESSDNNVVPQAVEVPQAANPLQPRTFVDVCMSNPTFRAGVISRLVSKLR